MRLQKLLTATLKKHLILSHKMQYEKDKVQYSKMNIALYDINTLLDCSL